MVNTGKFNPIWIPRVLAIAYIIFLSLFALDVFAAEAPFIEKLGGFFIHMLPSIILAAILSISWKHPLAGGLILILISIVFTFFFHTYRSPGSFLMLTLPLALDGALFVIFHYTQRKTGKAD